MKEEQAIWLYGSYARGDAGAYSDVDILVVGNSTPPSDLAAMYPRSHVAISQYSWEEMERMAAYGSVFLHHIRLEARPLLERPAADLRLISLLQTLGPYLRAPSDIEAFRQTLDDVETALSGDCSPDYEMAVLGSVARHASVLACFISGGPVFRREVAFGRLQGLLGLSKDPTAELENVYRYRLAEERGISPAQRATPADVGRNLDLIRSIIDKMEGIIDDYSRAVPS